MSITANYPNLRPSLLLDFANSQQLDERITFSRSTTAPYYDGKTSVLAEQNLLTYSQQIGGTNWSLQNVTASLNSATAPDGTTTASTITASVGLSAHAFYQNFGAILANTSYTKSYYLKAGTNNFASIIVNQSASATVYCVITINLSTGAITQTVNGSSLSVSSSAIVNIGSGYYRASLTFTSTIAISSTVSILTPNSSATPTIGNYGQETWTALGTETIIVWGGQAEQRSSVTAYNATTTSAITNYIPQLLTAPINAPRFDFNPTTGESLGLLIEQSSTNLCTYSADLSNAAWTKSNLSVNATANIFVDGTQTFNKLIEDSTTNQHRVFATAISATSGTAYTFTFYAKSAERTIVAAAFTGPGVSNSVVGCYINLSTQAVSNFGAAPTSTTVTAVGNNVYKISLVYSATATGSIYPQLYTVASVGTLSYLGDGYSGLFVGGIQFEALAFPTSYIATTSAQVTRASDNASMTGTNFSSWFNQGQGTIYCESSVFSVSGTSPGIYSFDDGTTSNALNSFYGTTIFANARINGSNVFTSNSSSIATTPTFYKQSFSYANANYISVFSGGSATTQASGLVPPNLNRLQIGLYNGSQLNGRMKKLAFYPLASTSAQLQALTGT